MEQHSCLTLRRRLRCHVQGRRRRARRVHPVRRQRLHAPDRRLRSVHGLPRRRGRVLRLDDDPIRHLAVRVLVARARHEDQPRAARSRRRRGWSTPPASIPGPCTRSSPPTRAASTRSRTRPTRLEPQTSNRRRASSPPTWRTRRTRSSGRPAASRRSSRHSSWSMTCASSPPKTARSLPSPKRTSSGGGPSTLVSLHYSNGQVSHYSLIFLIDSAILLIVHIPLLDRAERSRKEFLVGGTAPPWYGPA